MDSGKVEDFLTSLKHIVEPTSQEFDSVMELVDQPGFGVFLGMLLAAKEAFRVQLSVLPLGTPENQHLASVLQGRIQGIEVSRQTLLELAGKLQGAGNG